MGPSVACFVAKPVVEIVVIVSVVAAFVKDSLASLSVAEIASLVEEMSVGMYSYWLIGNFVGVGCFLRVIVVAEAERKLMVAVQTDL